MADDDGSRKEKKKKSKMVNVDKEVSKAMKQVEQAMKQVKMAEKQTKQAKKEGKHKKGDFSGMHIHTQLPSGACIQDGGIAFHNSETIHHGTYINIGGAQNVQVGNHNTMVINKRGKKKKKSRSSQSDSEDDDDDDGTATANREELQELEKLPIFTSKRPVTATDTDTICIKVSNWRRFLRFLDLNEANIENVYLEHFHNGGVKEVLLQGIKMWQRKEARGATIDIIAKALLRIECFDAVRELQP